MKKNWTDRLPSDVYVRLAECRNTKKDLPILVNTRWVWMAEKIEEGKLDKSFTKEDALVYILELLDANSQWVLADITRAEYDELKS